MHERHVLSPLGKTWIFDIDGTVAKHNGYKTDGHDTLLVGAKEFLKALPENDMVVFVTSRTEGEREATVSFLRENGIRFDHIIFGAPFGERVLVNDRKPSGLSMALAINTDRDCFMDVEFVVDEKL